MYIYIYIKRERERERVREYVYIYIYIRSHFGSRHWGSGPLDPMKVDTIRREASLAKGPGIIMSVSSCHDKCLCLASSYRLHHVGFIMSCLCGCLVCLTLSVLVAPLHDRAESQRTHPSTAEPEHDQIQGIQGPPGSPAQLHAPEQGTQDTRAPEEPNSPDAHKAPKAPKAPRPSITSSAPRDKTTFTPNGEPKSGTTWWTEVCDAVLTQLAEDSPSCKLSIDARLSRQKDFSMCCTGHNTITVSGHAKHLIGHTKWHPNDFIFERPLSISDEAMRKWAARSVATHDHMHWLTIFRDPRGIANSEYYFRKKYAIERNYNRRFGSLDGIGPDKYVLSRVGAVSEWTNLRYRFYTEVIKQTGNGGARPRSMFTTYPRLQQNMSSVLQELALYISGRELSTRAMRAILNETFQDPVTFRKASLCAFESGLKPETVRQITAIVNQTLLPELRHLLMAC